MVSGLKPELTSYTLTMLEQLEVGKYDLALVEQTNQHINHTHLHSFPKLFSVAPVKKQDENCDGTFSKDLKMYRIPAPAPDWWAALVLCGTDWHLLCC